ncbi:N-acetyltransferase family protein [Sphaerisporangium sp. NPDC005288]|uniref:GNAT family N-acetyltransferase n=1 Tax=Sphaerisporangium sp. NPDC005288 TaxID=3155114 RepID=UPI0033B63299
MPEVHATIRAATLGDLPAVAAIYTHYVLGGVATFEETPPGLEDWRRRLDDLAGRALPFLVAELDGTVAGYAYAGPFRPKPAYRHTVEDSIYLAPGHTGRGLGRALMGPLLSGCTRAGARQMVAVIADTGDPGSIALHEAFGFTRAGLLKEVGHKHGRWIDTVLMQRALTPTGD